jgi:spore cortex biosynthesis protein YabQ
LLGLLAQIKTFFLTLLLGIIAGIISHYYQLTIRALHVQKYSLYLLDLFFWLIMILLIAGGMLLINQGELRIYIFLVLIAGGLIYLKLMAGFMNRPLSGLAKNSALILRTIGNILVKPQVWLKKKAQFYWRRYHASSPPEDR